MLLTHHLSSGACTAAQLVADITTGLNLTPHHKTEKENCAATRRKQLNSLLSLFLLKSNILQSCCYTYVLHNDWECYGWTGKVLKTHEPCGGAVRAIVHVSVFIHQWLYSSLLGPGLFFSFVIFFTQTVGILGRVISPSQGHYLNTEQHKHRINAHTDIHAWNGIRTHNPSVRAGEDSSCFRLRGHCDRPFLWVPTSKFDLDAFILLYY
jgi:hypothetical protein